MLVGGGGPTAIKVERRMVSCPVCSNKVEVPSRMTEPKVLLCEHETCCSQFTVFPDLTVTLGDARSEFWEDRRTIAQIESIIALNRENPEDGYDGNEETLVDQLRDSIQKVKERLDGLPGEVAKLRELVSEKDEQISKLATRLHTLTREIQQLKARSKESEDDPPDTELPERFGLLQEKFKGLVREHRDALERLQKYEAERMVDGDASNGRYDGAVADRDRHIAELSIQLTAAGEDKERIKALEEEITLKDGMISDLAARLDGSMEEKDSIDTLVSELLELRERNERLTEDLSEIGSSRRSVAEMEKSLNDKVKDLRSWEARLEAGIRQIETERKTLESDREKLDSDIRQWKDRRSGIDPDRSEPKKKLKSGKMDPRKSSKVSSRREDP